ncbi:hypothetical protein [Acetobacter sicerae]|uniref:hypothetical protein n=1 Tax=Acetobacter sicerae TaxID=85325 RepID=UPI00156BB624|nr:hypothetical protein [Acetobacter sicerae]NHN93800.1 hypothetical protein [Acetobacter sicerae]
MTRSNTLNDMDAFSIVRKWADSFRSTAAAARSIGIDRRRLSEQLNADEEFSEEVLRAAGIVRVQPPAEYYLRDEI